MANGEGKREPIAAMLYDIMSKGQWWTLPELQATLQARGRLALATSISARLRDLRKGPWNRTVLSRTRDGASKLVEYHLLGSCCREGGECDVAQCDRNTAENCARRAS